MSPGPDRIAFELQPFKYGGRLRPRVEILINGQSLAELVTAEVGGSADADAPVLYGGLLALEDTLPPAQHFLGDPPCSLYRFGERTQVLTCYCGELGCRPLICRIEVNDDRVVWSGFGQPHRFAPNRFLSFEGLGPFVFERAQYEAALEALKRPA